jgi:hypothetical protein
MGLVAGDAGNEKIFSVSLHPPFTLIDFVVLFMGDVVSSSPAELHSHGWPLSDHPSPMMLQQMRPASREDATLKVAARRDLSTSYSVSFLLSLPHQIYPSQVDLKVLVCSFCMIDLSCLLHILQL